MKEITRLTATDKKTGAYVDSLESSDKIDLLDFHNDFSSLCYISMELLQ